MTNALAQCASPAIEPVEERRIVVPILRGEHVDTLKRLRRMKAKVRIFDPVKAKRFWQFLRTRTRLTTTCVGFAHWFKAKPLAEILEESIARVTTVFEHRNYSTRNIYFEEDLNDLKMDRFNLNKARLDLEDQIAEFAEMDPLALEQFEQETLAITQNSDSSVS